ncbi:MAG TPA: hypothetical protein PKA62_20380, partial [Thermoanaerobaculia bacterium]|nr:hypothetical protein [Thermoanaerobaculia bacterium]
ALAGGTVRELSVGLRQDLAPGSAVVLLSSNSTTCQPGWPAHLADALLEKTGGDSMGEVRRNLEAFLAAQKGF